MQTFPHWTQPILRPSGTWYIFYKCSWVPFCSTAGHFGVTDHFDTIVLNDPKITLTTKRSKVYCTCATSVPESQISVLFFYGHPFWSYMPFWDKCKGWPQNDGEHSKVKGTPIYVLLVSSNFSPVLFMTRGFRVTGHFKTGAPNDHNWFWSIQGQSYPIYVLLMSQSPNFHPRCSLTNHFQDTKISTRFHRKCTEWPQTDLEHSAVKNTLYILGTYLLRPKVSSGFFNAQPFSRYQVDENLELSEICRMTSQKYLYTLSTPKVQIWVCFALRPANFEIQDCRKTEKSKMHHF